MIPSGEREAHRQTVVRAGNEVIARSGADAGAARFTVSCECGDAGCRSHLDVTAAEYQAVRDHGSRFLIVARHENAETSIVYRSSPGFDEIESLGGEPLRIVLRADPRHAWPGRRDV